MSVNIQKLIKDLSLEVLVEGNNDVNVEISDINRPGLQFAGFYDYFANERVQVVGRAEWSFLDAMSVEIRKKRLKKFFKFKTPCVVITRNQEPHKELLDNAVLSNTWVLRTKSISTRFISKLMNYFDNELAPETRVHGVLVDVYGIGILITGESGIGKSESALELIKRGHRLVADDAVDIKSIDGVLRGSSPYITQGMLEVRGVGIIDVPALYGLSSILESKTIHLIINFEQWVEGKHYDRLGLERVYIKILGADVRKLTIPIRPGRNVAVIIETAAVNYRYSLNSKESPVDTIEKRMDVENNII
ncbi:HPr(Ser) kinase/phosphatase [Haloimpatiens sp. FM7315]|uniref:HPr(Ser) kinase/phosphatase n=1 Tax=Haloimpatiens sp. FM7315 TaxID=3298609 RepID=UPI00370B89DB